MYVYVYALESARRNAMRAAVARLYPDACVTAEHGYDDVLVVDDDLDAATDADTRLRGIFGLPASQRACATHGPRAILLEDNAGNLTVLLPGLGVMVHLPHDGSGASIADLASYWPRVEAMRICADGWVPVPVRYTLCGDIDDTRYACEIDALRVVAIVADDYSVTLTPIEQCGSNAALALYGYDAVCMLEETYHI